MIFPGMDPYLEAPGVWPDVHTRLIVYIAEQLQPRLRPRYSVAVERRVFVESPEHQFVPDVVVRKSQPARPATAAGAVVLEIDPPVEVHVPALEVREAYLQILDRQSQKRVVTVLEVVSPTNKYAGPGRDSYTAKQREVRASDAHLIEIDLLRTGPHVLAVPEWVARGQGAYDYLTCVNRAAGDRSRFQLYLTRLRDRLPRIGVPLAAGDADAVLDLQAALERTYGAGSYQDDIAYDRPCVPPLSPDDQAWADELIRAAQSRVE